MCSRSIPFLIVVFSFLKHGCNKLKFFKFKPVDEFFYFSVSILVIELVLAVLVCRLVGGRWHSTLGNLVNDGLNEWSLAHLDDWLVGRRESREEC